MSIFVLLAGSQTFFLFKMYPFLIW